MTDLTPEALAALNAFATGGEWTALAHKRGDGASIGDGAGNYIGEVRAHNNAAFIVALATLYRAEKLVHVDAPRVATAEMVEAVLRAIGGVDNCVLDFEQPCSERSGCPCYLRARAALRALGYEVRE